MKIPRSKLKQFNQNLSFKLEDTYNPLADNLQNLYSDHELGKKFCRHCVLKYKKSVSIKNIIFGNISLHFKLNYGTIFHLLEEYDKSASDYNNLVACYGLQININSANRLKSNANYTLKIAAPNDPVELLVTQINVPFMILTSDTGFFKNNLMVHISSGPTDEIERESPFVDQQPQNVRSRRINQLKIVPKWPIRDDANLPTSLDSQFYKYFLSALANIESLILRAEDAMSEQFVMESAEEKGGLDVTNIDNPSERQNQLYVLLVSKQYPCADLLPTFEKKRKEERDQYKNKLYFNIDEIQLDLTSSLAMYNTRSVQTNIALFQELIECLYPPRPREGGPQSSGSS